MPNLKTLKLCLYCCIASLFVAEMSYASSDYVSIVVLDQKGKVVKDAVVTLVMKNSTGEMKNSDLSTAIMTQKDVQFAPFVLPVVKGTRVKFPNFDNERHYIYSKNKRTRFELVVEAGEKDKSVVFDKVGIIQVVCGIHDNMKAYIQVVNTLDFGKSDANGMIKLDGLEAGEYQASIWHPRIKGDQKDYTQTVILGAEDPSKLTFQIPLKRERRRKKSKGNY